MLGIATTPLTGGVLVAARAVVSGRRGGALLALALGVAALGLGNAAVILLPLTFAGNLLLLGPLWGATGAALARIEAALDLAPPAEPDPATLRDVPAWALAWMVGGLPFAIGLALASTRWGAALPAKPSFAAEVLRIDLLVLVPLGLLAGLIRVAARRSARPAVPVVFAGVFPLSFLLPVPSAWLFDWLRDKVLHLPDMDAAANSVGPAQVAAITLLILFLAGLAEHVAGAAGHRAFLGRTLGVLGLMTGLVFTLELAAGTWGRAIGEERALRASARGDDAAAARLWVDNARRTTEAAHGPRTLERALLAALRASDATTLARAIRLTHEAAAAADAGTEILRLDRVAAAIAATPMAARPVPATAPDPSAAPAPAGPLPVRPESYLSDDHTGRAHRRGRGARRRRRGRAQAAAAGPLARP